VNAENLPNNQDSKSNTGPEPNKQPNAPKPEVLGAATEPQAQPSQHCHKITCEKKRDWIDKTTLVLEGLGLSVLIIYTIATIIYACITHNMWQEMQTQTGISQQTLRTGQRQLEATERPWLKISFAVQRLASKGNGIDFNTDGSLQLSLLAIITNTGHSVATDVVVPMKAFLAYDTDTIFKKPLRVQSEMCDKVASTPLGKPDESQMAVTIFPGDTDNSTGHGVGIDKAEIDAAPNAAPRAPGPKRLYPIIVGCVDYQYGTSEKHHQTRFILDIQRVDRTVPKGIYPVTTIKNGQSVSTADVYVSKYAFGGFWAN
jgi:hypothetical protein